MVPGSYLVLWTSLASGDAPIDLTWSQVSGASVALTRAGWVVSLRAPAVEGDLVIRATAVGQDIAIAIATTGAEPFGFTTTTVWARNGVAATAPLVTYPGSLTAAGDTVAASVTVTSGTCFAGVTAGVVVGASASAAGAGAAR